MELFGRNFLKIRNESIIPLIGYGIKKNKTEYWGFKDVITNNLISLNKISNNSYELEISKSDFYKALHCDIELFLNKATVQYNDFLVSHNNSPTWSFVTLYYFTFFSMTTLFRLLRKGFIFLQEEQVKNIENFSLAMYSDVIKVNPGNYYFSFIKENAVGNVIISLNHKGEGVHKLSWIQLESTIREFLSSCDTDEKTFFTSLLNFFRFYKSDFPSTLRNTLNYHGSSSMLDLDKKLFYITLQLNTESIVRGTLALKVDRSLESQINAVSYLSTFLFKYINELYQEYNSRSAFGSDFNKHRKDYLKSKGILLD